MLGTILYALLDVSLNTTIWATKTISLGIYNGYNYIMNYETESEDISYNITFPYVWHGMHMSNVIIVFVIYIYIYMAV